MPHKSPNPCRKCGGPAHTTSTRPDTPQAGMFLRFKQCQSPKCGHRWNTIEMSEISGMASLINPLEDERDKRRHQDEAVEIATVAVAMEVRKLLVGVLTDFDRRFKTAATSATSTRYALPNGSASRAAAPAAKTAKRPVGRPPKVRPGERQRAPRFTKASGGKVTPSNPEGIPYNTRDYILSKGALLPEAFRKDAEEIRQAYEAFPKRDNGAREVPDAFKELLRTYWDMTREAGVQKVVAAGAVGMNTSNFHRWAVA